MARDPNVEPEDQPIRGRIETEQVRGTADEAEDFEDAEDVKDDDEDEDEAEGRSFF